MKPVWRLSISILKKEKNAILAFKKALNDSLRNNIISLSLFGSTARGDSDGDSDIDILIVLNEISWEITKEISRISLDIDLKYNVNISPTVFSMEEYNKNKYFKSSFIQNLEKESIAI